MQLRGPPPNGKYAYRGRAWSPVGDPRRDQHGGTGGYVVAGDLGVDGRSPLRGVGRRIQPHALQYGCPDEIRLAGIDGRGGDAVLDVRMPAEQVEGERQGARGRLMPGE
jgi:hypothetical protein